MKNSFRKVISLFLCFALVFGMSIDCIALTVEDNYSPFDSEDTSGYTLYSNYSTGTIDDITWSVYDNGLLEISGTGVIPSYSNAGMPPWYSYRSRIKRILVRDTITEIGKHAFNGLSVISVTLPFVGKSRTATGPEATFGYVFGYTTRVANSTATSTRKYVPIYNGNTTSRVAYISSYYYGSSSGNYDGSSPYYNLLTPSTDYTYKDFGFNSNGRPYLYSSSYPSTTFYNYRVGAVTSNTSSFSSANPASTTWQYTCLDYQLSDNDTFNNYAMQSYYYYIPSTLKTVTITDASKVEDCAFMNCTNLKEINLNNEITAIHQKAFLECTNLDVFDLPKSLNTLDAYSFYNCDSITDITIPNGITVINEAVFYDCDSLYNVNFNHNITAIGDVAFYGCGSLEDFELPEKLKTIGDYAFAYCSSVYRIVIPNDVTTIGSRAFYSCYAYSIIIGDSVTTIKEKAFANQYITSLYVPNNVTVIETGAFYGCNKLTQVTLPFVGKSRTATGPEATFGYIFDYTTRTAYSDASSSRKYVKIYRGDNSTYVGYVESYKYGTNSSSYVGCSPYYNEYVTANGYGYSDLGFYSAIRPYRYSSLYSSTTFYDYRIGEVASNTSTSFSNPTNTTWQYTCLDYKLSDNSTYNDYAMQSYFYYIPSSLTKVTITDASRIETAAFMNCANLEEINLNDEITYVATNAYRGCSATVTKEPLDNEKVTYPNSYTYTNGKDSYTYSVDNGEATIIGCSTTSENITLPTVIDGIPVVAIGYKGMANCTTLKSATIPNSITKLDIYAFTGCTNIDTVTIPATCKYVGSYAFSGCSKLTTVVIAEGVEFIGDNCFENCVMLAEIVVPDSCTHLGKYAFYNCTSLESATIGITVPHIEKYTFYNCNQLQSVVLGLSVETIGEYAFYNTALSRVVTYNKLVSIGKYAFANCDELTRVTLRAGIVNIDEGAFKDDILLSTINTPSTITDIGAYAFYNCQSLASLTIPELVTQINDYTFAHCYTLASVKVNGTIESIGYYAFYRTILSDFDFKEGLTTIEQGAFESNKLTEIVLPSTLTYIGEQAFSKNADLTSLSMPDSVSTVRAYAFAETGEKLDVVVRYNSGTVAANMLENTPITSVIIEDGITAIGDYSFAYCNNLSKITFPETLQTIGSHSFFENRKYSEITLPKNVTSIGTYAFARGYALKKLTIPDSVQTIGESAFYRGSDKDTVPDVTVVIYYNGGVICDNLLDAQHMNHVFVNDNIYSLGNNAFSNATNLETVSLPDTISSCGTQCFYNSSTELYIRNVDGLIDDSVYREKLSGVNYLETNDTNIGSYAFYGNTNYYDLKVNNGLIGDYAFAENTWLNDVQINGVTDIGDYAFSNDISLDSVKITGQSNVGDYAFYNCNAMKEFVIDGTIERIGEHAFDSCKSMGGVVLPSTVNYIGAYAFYDCNSMDSINIPNGVEKLLSHTFYGCASLGEVVVPDSVIEIQDYVFYGCVKATSIILSNQCKSIGEAAFYNCKGLLALEIPESVKSIGNYAFRSCVAIKELVFSDNLEDIGACAFYDCNGLETIMFGTGIVELNDRLFYGCVNLQDITLNGDVNFIHDLAFYGAEATVVYAFENDYVETYCNDMGLEFYNLNRNFTMVLTSPTKLQYNEYDELDLTGLALDLTYTNGMERTIKTGYEVSGYDPAKLGTQTITITYNGQSTTFDITVVAKVVNTIQITAGAPTDVIVGEELNYSDMIIKATFVDDTNVDLTEGYTVTGYDAETVGEQTITVTYREGSCTFIVNVKDYVRGDINGDGLVTMKDVTRLVNYLNENSVEVIDKSLDVNGDGLVTIKDVTRLVEYLENNTVEIY